MNLVEALQKLQDGHKIRHSGWRNDTYIHIVDDNIVSEDGLDTTIFITNNIFSSGWEIYYVCENGLYFHSNSKIYYLHYDKEWVYWRKELGIWSESNNSHDSLCLMFQDGEIVLKTAGDFDPNFCRMTYEPTLVTFDEKQF